MNKKKLHNISGYFALRNEMDILLDRIMDMHNDNIQCKPGCDKCCMDFSILPVEFMAIKQEAAEKLKEARKDIGEKECPFLVEGKCLIYRSRPFICRTQGLPLLFMGEESWELSVCDMNFRSADSFDFDQQNTFPLDKFNSRLFMINKEFIEGLSYSDTDLIPLRNLADNHSG